VRWAEGDWAGRLGWVSEGRDGWLVLLLQGHCSYVVWGRMCAPIWEVGLGRAGVGSLCGILGRETDNGGKRGRGMGCFKA
jgi:hypothetical protein